MTAQPAPSRKLVAFTKPDTAPQFERLSVIKSEELLISYVLQNGDAFHDIADTVHSSDFFILSHAYIWRAFERLGESNTPIDLVTVDDFLEQNAPEHDAIKLSALSGRYIDVKPEHVTEHAQRVYNMATARRLMKASDEMKALVLDGSPASDIQDIVEACNDLVYNATAERLTQVQTIQEQKRAYIKMLTDLQAGKVNGSRWGFRHLSEALGIQKAGELAAVIGRTGTGKTTLIYSMELAEMTNRIFSFDALAGAVKLQEQWETAPKSVVISLEMKADELIGRLVNILTGIPYTTQRSTPLNAEQMSRVSQALEIIEKLPLVIDDSKTSLKPSEFRTMCKRYTRKYAVRRIVVDGLDRMTADAEPRGQRAQNSGDVYQRLVSSLIETARDCDVPVLVLQQPDTDSLKNPKAKITLGNVGMGSQLVRQVHTALALQRGYEDKPDALEVLKHRPDGSQTGKEFPVYFNRGHYSENDPRLERAVPSAYKDEEGDDNASLIF